MLIGAAELEASVALALPASVNPYWYHISSNSFHELEKGIF